MREIKISQPYLYIHVHSVVTIDKIDRDIPFKNKISRERLLSNGFDRLVQGRSKAFEKWHKRGRVVSVQKDIWPISKINFRPTENVLSLIIRFFAAPLYHPPDSIIVSRSYVKNYL